jgi:hypothetical protein
LLSQRIASLRLEEQHDNFIFAKKDNALKRSKIDIGLKDYILLIMKLMCVENLPVSARQNLDTGEGAIVKEG